jgi:uncharacterized membrane protein
MFVLTFLFGFVFTLLGFFDLKETVTKKDTPALGFVYFIVGMLVWFVMAMYWPAMATDAALASLGWLWFGLAWVCVACAMACVGFILKAGIKSENGKLSIQQSSREQ